MCGLLMFKQYGTFYINKVYIQCIYITKFYDREKMKDNEMNKTSHVSFRFPNWLIDFLDEKSVELSIRDNKRHTKTEIIIEALINHCNAKEYYNMLIETSKLTKSKEL